MYYYKTFYIDGTWAYVKSKKSLTPKDVCKTCYALKRKSAIWYWLNRILHGEG